MMNGTFSAALRQLNRHGLSYLQTQVIGHGRGINTPFGQSPLIYADYTASGRGLKFIEESIGELLEHYANTHTEDDHTGVTTTETVHEAEQVIRNSVGADNSYSIIPCGTGATGAIDRLQKILGIAIAPATKESILNSFDTEEEGLSLWKQLERRAPVVFVGPYEHHSNEVSWRQGLCTVVPIGLDREGHIDLEQLETELSRLKFADRQKIGSFSAASNVTGLRSDVDAIAALLHSKGAIACFDYAASGPYVEINMRPESPEGEDLSLDAIYLSPHKFLGGPGASGLLVLKNDLYKTHLAPTIAGGGTVSFVSHQEHDFIDNIEERENGGTPGILQTIRTGMVMAVKQELSTKAIDDREHDFLGRAFSSWKSNERIEILGNQDPNARVGIVSFNIKDPRGRYLHPKLVTTLLNDLYGIQSRAGCSCAGPYGHLLLNVDSETSLHYRHAVEKGYSGLKPGWCRIGFHYVLSESEIQYIVDAVTFIADYGYRFVHLYEFDLETGDWILNEDAYPSTQSALWKLRETLLGRASLESRMAHCKRRALTVAARLEAETPEQTKELDPELRLLQYFSLA